jgi:hypothetical protein
MSALTAPLGTGLGKVKGKMFHGIGHLGDCNDHSSWRPLVAAKWTLKLSGVKLAGRACRRRWTTFQAIPCRGAVAQSR